MRVALTMDTEQRGRPADDGNPGRLLDILAAEGAPATFFVQGRWAGANHELACRIRDDGHLLGNHSYYHAPMDFLTDAGIRDSVTRAEEVILAVTGSDPRPWFRCPYGAGEVDPRVLGILAELGYANVTWDFETDDWADGRDAGDLVETIVAGCSACGDGARVLLHSWPDVTVVALPRIIERLREAGADLVRLGDLGAAASRPAHRDELS
jgi:peptidoglycan/xylan/chitin deacetylase (PgdA/CDA1 family)